MEIGELAEFLRYYEGVRERTRRVVGRVPADRLEWRYAEDRFSCGDLIRHLAGTERYMFAENVRGRPSSYPGHARALADGRDAVIEYFERLHGESMEIIGGLSAADLRAKCETPAGIRISTWKWLRAMVEHEVHHRGQLYVVLGLMGVETPPLYGLTEPEVRSRSVPLTDG